MTGDTPDETAEQSEQRSDPVISLLDRLDRLDNSHDPMVAIFDGLDADPVVAQVGDGYRMLSSAVIYAREISIEDIRTAWDRNGEPRVAPLSTQTHRFDASDFREVADLE